MRILLAVLAFSMLVVSHPARADVAQAKSALAKIGCYTGQIDQASNLKFKSAVRCYQRAKGFEVANGVLTDSLLASIVDDAARGFQMPDPAEAQASSPEEDIKAAVEAARRAGAAAGTIDILLPDGLRGFGRLVYNRQFTLYAKRKSPRDCHTDFLLLYEPQPRTVTREVVRKAILEGKGHRVTGSCRSLRSYKLRLQSPKAIIFEGSIDEKAERGSPSRTGMNPEDAAIEIFSKLSELGLLSKGGTPRPALSFFEKARNPKLMTALGKGEYRTRDFHINTQSAMRTALVGYVHTYSRECVRRKPANLTRAQIDEIERRIASFTTIKTERTWITYQGFFEVSRSDPTVVGEIKVHPPLAGRYLDIRNENLEPAELRHYRTILSGGAPVLRGYARDIEDMLKHFGCSGPEIDTFERELLRAASLKLVRH